ncbi:MAG: hypothetical protein PHX34_00285 [Candidatus Shapirobacteria bacterium]|nr:hypothetical protein [Candidatus Shapirobacteria bacterium]
MSLTYTANLSRKIIKYGGLGIILFVILWTSITLGYKVYRAANPIYVAPTKKYGILPKIVFPDKEKINKNFTFEFANDIVPNFSDQARVYVIYRPNSSFLALEKDKETAKKFGFETNPIEIKTGIYEFKNEELNKTLTINVLDGSFELTYPYTKDQLLLNPTKMPTKTEAIEVASSFLEKGDKLTTDLKNGKKEVSYWKIESEILTAANSQAEANIARVDFYRAALNDLSVVSKDVGQASVSVLVSGSDVVDKKILEVKFKDLDIDNESFSTYPIKTANEAINDLNTGNYWPTSDVAANNVTIRKVYLAYFEPITLTNFLQPIFVFEGDNNFMAYIPAVSSSLTK